MLQNIHVSNYALIEKLSIDFGKGLTILTGETGTGKSILLGALQLILGERADLTSIKNPEKKCVLEATFNIEKLNLNAFFDQLDWDYEDETILRREILPSGKSRAFVNDVPVRLNELRELSKKLIDIHSQFETRSLLHPEFQIPWLDAVANNQKIFTTYTETFALYQKTKKAFTNLTEQKTQFEQEKEYIQFLWDELDKAELDNISLSVLETEQNRLENAENITESLAESYQLLENEPLGILLQLHELNQKFKKLESYPEFQSLAERLQSVQIELHDITAEIQAKAEANELNPEQLEKVNAQINLLHQLFQKHQTHSVENLLKIRNELSEKLEQNLSVEQQLGQLNSEQKKLYSQLENIVEILSENRKKAAQKVEEEILQTIANLGMENANIQFKIIPENSFTKWGKEQVEILFSANKGSNLVPLEKAVSGGELSRLMIAIKKSLAQHLELPILILDEIDTGISGKTANQMGDLMQQMSQYLQLIAITHLPQIAAKGKQHYKVFKQEKNGNTTSHLALLSSEQRIEEIAQLISGESISNLAKQQAAELLKNSL